MKTIDKLMAWPRPQEELLLYFLLLLRGCKTKQDIENAYNDPVLKYRGWSDAFKELVENLPQILKTLNAIYGEEKGGEQ